MKKGFSVKILTLVTGLIFSFSAFSASFEGVGKGFANDIVVEAEITDNKITAINVKAEEESDFAKPAMQEIIDKVIATQNLKVDDVAGATATSKGVKRAISNAVKKSGATLTEVK